MCVVRRWHKGTALVSPLVTTLRKLAYAWLSFSHSLCAFNTYQETQHTFQNREAHRRQEHMLHGTIRKGTKSTIGITYHGSIPYYIKCTNDHLRLRPRRAVQHCLVLWAERDANKRIPQWKDYIINRQNRLNAPGYIARACVGNGEHYRLVLCIFELYAVFGGSTG